MNAIPEITLNNGVRIPQLGFGTFQIKPEDTTEATLRALEVGYRHIDTAEMYRNETEIGEAMRRFGIEREKVFVTSKLDNRFHARDAALAAFDRTLADLGLEQIDLFLIHWPLPEVLDYVGTWQAMIEIYESGRARAVGVSNFQISHLRRLLDETGLVPAVNQIEVSPYLTQDRLREFGAKHGIATESWSPIARGKVTGDPAIRAVGERLGRTAAQVTLLWHLQRGDIVFPKSLVLARMEENFALFDFELDDDAMAALSGLNRNERTGPDPDTFNGVPES